MLREGGQTHLMGRTLILLLKLLPKVGVELYVKVCSDGFMRPPLSLLVLLIKRSLV